MASPLSWIVTPYISSLGPYNKMTIWVKVFMHYCSWDCLTFDDCVVFHQKIPWCSCYHFYLIRERSPVRSRAESFFRLQPYDLESCIMQSCSALILIMRHVVLFFVFCLLSTFFTFLKIKITKFCRGTAKAIIKLFYSILDPILY